MTDHDTIIVAMETRLLSFLLRDIPFTFKGLLIYWGLGEGAIRKKCGGYFQIAR